MKHILRKVFFSVGILVGLIVIIIGLSFVNHLIQLSKEKNFFLPVGTMVEVNGHNLHVYTEGRGTQTLVFMSGGGTCSPYLDFKSLYSFLSDTYTIAVVEKTGYGFSDDAKAKRDINTIVDETRDALSKSGLQAPYILFPHSMSGIEALYWAQKYPHEIKGIVGLDMTVPLSYDNFSVNPFVMQLGAFGSFIGITRFFPSIVTSSAAIQYGSLTDQEKELYRVIFYRRTLTKAMREEVREIKSNAQKVLEGRTPEVPLLFFVSTGEGTGWGRDVWVKAQIAYIEATQGNSYVELDCSHYVHNIATEKIACESRKFIETKISLK